MSKAISLDEKVNVLPDDTCRLLFTWLITHLDCEGRMHGDPVTVKSIVFPRRDIPIKKVENYLKILEKYELIFRYCVNGNQYLLMKSFEKHQPGLRKDKEAQSVIPPFTPNPTPDLTPDLGQSEDRKGLKQVKVKVKVEEEVKEEDKDNISSEKKGDNNGELTDLEIKVIQAYQDSIMNGNPIDDFTLKGLRLAIKNYSPQWIIDAIKEACNQDKGNWAFITQLLLAWKKFGKPKTSA